jgi:hypothetical protein
MYLVIRHHLANGFRRPCVFSCQMAIDSHQTTMDSYQTTMDRRQVNRTAGECSRARRMGRMSHKVATQIENALQQILQHDADTLARQTGFVQRQRKLTGSTFAQLMVFGAASNPCPTYTDWTQAAALAGTLITPQGIEQRFTPQAAPLPVRSAPTLCRARHHPLHACGCPSAPTLRGGLHQGQHGD